MNLKVWSHPYVIFMYLRESDSDVIELILYYIPWNVDVPAAILAHNALK